MIIRRARGSLRDALTMLEKCIFDKKVETQNVEAALHLVSLGFLRETFDACKDGKAEEIQKILSTLEKEATDVRQFAAQMTEWIVENINEAFEQKSFPLYQEIFDLFTRIYVQSRQVAVPMDIMRMALYERIKSGTIKKTPTHTSEEKKDALPLREEKLTPPTLELPIPEHEIAPASHALPETKGEIPAPTHEIADVHAVISGDFSAENYLKKLQELQIKGVILPLIRTAKIVKIDDEIRITTTLFGK